MEKMRIDRIKLCALLASKDWTSVKLAQTSGLSRQTISQIKNGKRCYEETAHKIANALGVALEELLEVRA